MARTRLPHLRDDTEPIKFHSSFQYTHKKVVCLWAVNQLAIHWRAARLSSVLARYKTRLNASPSALLLAHTLLLACV